MASARRPRSSRLRRLIVVLHEAAGADALEQITKAAGIEPRRLLAREPKHAARAARRKAAAPVPHLGLYHHVEVAEGHAERIAKRLRRLSSVAAVYEKPATDVPGRTPHWPRPHSPLPTTPDFTRRQHYLRPAPRGIDAQYAWTVRGGAGDGVRIIDVEKAWNFKHEELRGHTGVVGGSPTDDVAKRNHGTAVAGLLNASRNASGVTGICWRSKLSGFSIFDGSSIEHTSDAILQAADMLDPGDVMLLELHRPGPRYNYQPDEHGQLGYIPIEWWPDDFAAIHYATSAGIIVVEAAANGRENLDDRLYDTPHPSFPRGWHNPFRRGRWDSGAIVVGAGIPPGSTAGPDRSRLRFSNFGAMIDAQGYGRDVTSSGYGDLQGGADARRWYTRIFGGTSGASAMVAGAIACVQGALRTAGRPLLTPATARAALRATGSPQQAGPGVPTSERIGNRPDLRRLFASVGLTRSRRSFRHRMPSSREGKSPDGHLTLGKCSRSHGGAGAHVSWLRGTDAAMSRQVVALRGKRR